MVNLRSLTDAVSLRSVHPHDSSLEMAAVLVDDFSALDRHDSLKMAAAAAAAAVAAVGKYDFSAMNSLMFAAAADTVELFRACFLYVSA